MRRQAAGFTLLEVLLATALLAAGLVLAFATLRSAAAVGQRGEAMARQSEQIRTVEQLLRRQLAGALPQAMEKPRDGAPPQLFVGQPQRMRFVAEIPDYLGQGGPYVHELALAAAGPARPLQLRLTLLQAGEPVAAAALPPETLVAAPQGLKFAYRGTDPETGRLGDWQDQWPWPQRLPQLVRIELGSDGERWPPLLVALPQASPAQQGRP